MDENYSADNKQFKLFKCFEKIIVGCFFQLSILVFLLSFLRVIFSASILVFLCRSQLGIKVVGILRLFRKLELISYLILITKSISCKQIDN